MTAIEKDKIKKDLVTYLSDDSSIEKVVIFGSFLKEENPHDLDIAIFSDEDKDYLTLAMKYRRKLRRISGQLSIDVIPVKPLCDEDSSFLKEIYRGEVVYEKRD